MSISLTEFDAGAYLDSEEAIAEFLSAALERNDPEIFLNAVGAIAEARGMAANTEGQAGHPAPGPKR